MSSKNNNIVNAIEIVPQEEVITRTESKSQLIRRLFFTEGMTIKEIASKTAIRYQMVRNVVVSEKDKRELAELRNK